MKPSGPFEWVSSGLQSLTVDYEKGLHVRSINPSLSIGTLPPMAVGTGNLESSPPKVIGDDGCGLSPPKLAPLSSLGRDGEGLLIGLGGGDPTTWSLGSEFSFPDFSTYFVTSRSNI